MAGAVKNIIVVGAGYGGITAALRLAKLLRKKPEYRIRLCDKNPYHTLKTQLHEAAVGSSGVAIPIDGIIRKTGIIFHRAEITRIDPAGKTVHITDAVLPFDYLAIALGSGANFYGIPGLQDYSFPLQTLDDARMIYDRISSECELASGESDPTRRRGMLRYVVGGGGLSGVEFAAELAQYINMCTDRYGLDPKEAEIIVVEAGNRLVPHMDEAFSLKIQTELSEKGVRIITGARIAERTQDAITLSTGEVLKTATLIWTGGIRISDLFSAGGMKTGQLGRIVVDGFLRAEGYPYIYAVGDNALAMNPKTGDPIPAAAQFALQQGRLVADNIYADIFGCEVKTYTPKVLGEMVALGKHLAIGWMALPFLKKIVFMGFLGRLLKAAVHGRHIFLLKKESRNWTGF